MKVLHVLLLNSLRNSLVLCGASNLSLEFNHFRLLAKNFVTATSSSSSPSSSSWYQQQLATKKLQTMYALPFAVESVVAVCQLRRGMLPQSCVPPGLSDSCHSPHPLPPLLFSFCQRLLSFSLLSQWHFMIQTSLYMLTFI